MEARIQEKLRTILEEHKPMPLDSEVEAKIDAVIRSAQERLGI
jgi:trimethylamine:corrinoid methyltransferase-like protein